MEKRQTPMPRQVAEGRAKGLRMLSIGKSAAGRWDPSAGEKRRGPRRLKNGGVQSRAQVAEGRARALLAPEMAPPRDRAANAAAKSRAQGARSDARSARSAKRQAGRRRDSEGACGAPGSRDREGAAYFGYASPRDRAKMACHGRPQRQPVPPFAKTAELQSPAARPSGLCAAQSRAQGARSGARSVRSAKRQAGRRRVSERRCGAPDRPAFAPSGLCAAKSAKQGPRWGAAAPRSANRFRRLLKQTAEPPYDSNSSSKSRSSGASTEHS